MVKTLEELKALWIKKFKPAADDYSDLFDTIFSMAGSTGSTPITFADLTAAVLAQTVTEGFYLITDATTTYGDRGSYAAGGVIVQVTKDTSGILRISNQAIGLFFNPDYQHLGNYYQVELYTGVAVANLIGMWSFDYEQDAPQQGDIVIYNGAHYQLTQIAHLNGLGPIDNDTAYTILSFGMGFIPVADEVIYSFDADILLFRADSRGNRIFAQGISIFQWGNDARNDCSTSETASIICINARGDSTGINAMGSSSVMLDNTHTGSINYMKTYGSATITANMYFPNTVTDCSFQKQSADGDIELDPNVTYLGRKQDQNRNFKFFDAAVSNTFVANDNTEGMYFNPDGGTFNGTVVFPPNALDGQEFTIACTGNGQFNPFAVQAEGLVAIDNPPITLGANTRYKWIFIASKGTWYRLQ